MKKQLLTFLLLIYSTFSYSQNIGWRINPIEVTDSCVTLSFKIQQDLDVKNTIYFDIRSFYMTFPHNTENLWYLPSEESIARIHIDTIKHSTILPIVLLEDTLSNFYYYGVLEDCQSISCNVISRELVYREEWGADYFILDNSSIFERSYIFDKQQFREKNKVRLHYFYNTLSLHQLKRLGERATELFLYPRFGERYTEEELFKKLESLPSIHIVSNWFSLEN